MSRNSIFNRLFLLICLIVATVLNSCSYKDRTPVYRTSIERSSQQDSLFKKIEQIIGSGVTRTVLRDSFSVFILPIEAACSACRNKAIDSIVKYAGSLPDNRMIIISGSGSRNISSFFTQRNHKAPISGEGIFIDSTNMAFVNDLVYTTPSIYHSYNRRVYEKISCVPVNIKEQLHSFFSGN